MTRNIKELIASARKHALPDPHDERDVLHALLLRDLANALEQQAKEIEHLNSEDAGPMAFLTQQYNAEKLLLESQLTSADARIAELEQRNLSLEVFAPEIDKVEELEKHIAELQAELDKAEKDAEIGRFFMGKMEICNEGWVSDAIFIAQGDQCCLRDAVIIAMKGERNERNATSYLYHN